MTNYKEMLTDILSLTEEETKCVIRVDAMPDHQIVSTIESLSIRYLNSMKAKSITLIPAGYDVELKQYSFTLKTIRWAIQKLLRKQKVDYNYTITNYKAVCHSTEEVFEVTFELDSRGYIMIAANPELLEKPASTYNIDVLKIDDKYTIEEYDVYPEDDPGYIYDTHLRKL